MPVYYCYVCVCCVGTGSSPAQLIPTERSRPGTSGQPMLDTRNLRDRHLGARDTQENDACMAMVVQDQITHEEEITPLHDMSYMNAILYEEARGLGPVKLLPAQASHRPPAVTLEDQRLAFNVVDSRVVADITRPSHSVADPSPSTGVSSEHPVATAFAVASNTVTSRSQRSLELGAAGTAAESPRAITSRTQTGSRALSSVNASFVSVNSASNDNAVLVSSPLASTYTVPSSSGSSFSGTASVRSGQQLDSGIDTSQVCTNPYMHATDDVLYFNFNFFLASQYTILYVIILSCCSEIPTHVHSMGIVT